MQLPTAAAVGARSGARVGSAARVWERGPRPFGGSPAVRAVIASSLHWESAGRPVETSSVSKAAQGLAGLRKSPPFPEEGIGAPSFETKDKWELPDLWWGEILVLGQNRCGFFPPVFQSQTQPCQKPGSASPAEFGTYSCFGVCKETWTQMSWAEAGLWPGKARGALPPSPRPLPRPRAMERSEGAPTGGCKQDAVF